MKQRRTNRKMRLTRKPQLKSARREATRSVARYPVNGVAAVTSSPWGGSLTSSAVRSAMQAMDATIPKHLALPVNVGPYTVIRTTTIVNSTDTVQMYGFFRGERMTVTSSDTPIVTTSLRDMEGWAPYIGVTGNAGQTPSLNSKFKACSQLNSLGPAATLAPAAMTVQVMSGRGLAGDTPASGILYMGNANTQFRLEGSTTTWNDIGQDFVSYQKPRLVAGSRLALRGVKMVSKPYNIQELYDMDRLVDPVSNTADAAADVDVPWTSSETSATNTAENGRWKMKGFAPSIIYNPNNADITCLVTAEWRVRFDYQHPASSTHRHHPAAPTGVWDRVQQGLHAAGPNVQDIVESVATTGMNAIAQAGMNRLSQAAAQLDLMAMD